MGDLVTERRAACGAERSPARSGSEVDWAAAVEQCEGGVAASPALQQPPDAAEARAAVGLNAEVRVAVLVRGEGAPVEDGGVVGRHVAARAALDGLDQVRRGSVGHG